MGEFFDYKCRECGKDTHVPYGIGMMMSSLKEMLEHGYIKQKDIRKTLKMFYSSDSVRYEEFYKTSYCCRQCKALSSELYIKLQLNNGDEYVPEYKCKVCDGDLKRIPQEEIIADARCPHCGGTFRGYIGFGDWD